MIKQDRIELNERFKKVYELLVEQGEIIKNDRNGKGVGDFAERVIGKKGYGHIVQAYLKSDNKRVISYTQARTLCREYGVSEDYMMYGIGEPFPVRMPQKLSAAHEDEAYYGWRPNIQYTTVEAFAGDTVGAEAVIDNDDDKFMIPGVAGDGYVAFPIKGRSMEPVIEDRDIVVCRKVDRFEDIKENEIYALRHDGNLWVKYLQKITNSNGRVVGFKCISANHLEYDPFSIEVDPSTQLFKVVRRISEI